jgi:hypothetical protein
MNRLNRREKAEQRDALIASYVNPPFMNLKARLAAVEAKNQQARLRSLVIERAAERAATRQPEQETA